MNVGHSTVNQKMKSYAGKGPPTHVCGYSDQWIVPLVTVYGAALGFVFG